MQFTSKTYSDLTMKKIKKACPECKKIKPLTEFVDLAGADNPRGKYCRACFEARQFQSLLELLDGRDYCLYCGKKFRCTYERLSDGSTKHLVERDHMDPLIWGGGFDEYEGQYDDDRDPYIAARNTVYCCRECNQLKGDMLFVDWLKQLQPRFRRLARKVYIEKHGHRPEKFKPERMKDRYTSTWTISAVDDPDL